MTDNTCLFNLSVIKKANIKETLKNVCNSLESKGYNPVNQLIGYLMSGDPGFISSFQNAREKLTELDRADILEFLLTEYLKCDI